MSKLSALTNTISEKTQQRANAIEQELQAELSNLEQSLKAELKASENIIKQGMARHQKMLLKISNYSPKLVAIILGLVVTAFGLMIYNMILTNKAIALQTQITQLELKQVELTTKTAQSQQKRKDKS